MTDPEEGTGRRLRAKGFERAFAIDRTGVVFQQQWCNPVVVRRQRGVATSRRAKMYLRQPQRAQAGVADDEAASYLIPNLVRRDAHHRPRAVGQLLRGR